MKLFLVPNLVILAAVAVLLPACSRHESDETESQKPASSQTGSVSLDAALQERMGLEIKAVDAAEVPSRLPVTGRVVDVTALSSQAADLAGAEAAAQASVAERKRLRTLAAQNNASERALQAAEAAAARDQAQADSARLKMAAAWGPAIAGRGDLSRWMESFASGQTALVRVDLPAGQVLHSDTPKANLFTLAGERVDAEFLSAAPAVDPQTQGRSWFYLVQPNPAKLLAGMAVSGYVEETGPPMRGVLMPRDAVLRYEGEGWVYQESDGTNFARVRIPLDVPVEQGWFIPDGIRPGSRIVVTGAQSVLSRELNGAGFQSGDRD